jgi:hypothetical protein
MWVIKLEVEKWGGDCWIMRNQNTSINVTWNKDQAFRFLSRKEALEYAGETGRKNGWEIVEIKDDKMDSLYIDHDSPIMEKIRR